MEKKSNKQRNNKSMVPAQNAKGQQRPVKSFSRRGRRERTREVQQSVGTMTLNNREYVGDVKANDTLVFRINPGNYALFPWLSRIACNYDKYEIKRLTLSYVPTSSNLIQGTVAMTLDTDPQDPVALDKRAMFSNAGTVRSQVFRPCRLVYSKADLRRNGVKYTSSSEEKEPRDADSGFMTVKAFDVLTAPDTACGEVWVDYKITFYNPQLCVPTAPAGCMIVSKPKLDSVFAESTITGPQLCTLDSKTGALRCPTPGDYLLTVEMEGEGITEAPIVQSSAGVTPIDVIIDGGLKRGFFSYAVSALTTFTIFLTMLNKAKTLRAARATMSPFFRAYNPDMLRSVERKRRTSTEDQVEECPDSD